MSDVSVKPGAMGIGAVTVRHAMAFAPWSVLVGADRRRQFGEGEYRVVERRVVQDDGFPARIAGSVAVKHWVFVSTPVTGRSWR
ncbi:hypothetical protein [Streptomyces sp. HB132]|uniref:hypothetical protein n=1 Tax=Streptomyces sp. HB132 TaxID=767388 RepID=UPI00196070C6|nr:hypothetical protein [Streptomyces sp. HB132]MBM7442613.1 hypothetical protein [Streptomyces sp. HB132]